MPPQELPVTNRVIRIEDIDRAVKQWFERVVDTHVSSPDGSRRKVAVKFSSGERWVAAADQQGVRDKDGRLILPIIQISRTEIDPMGNDTALASNVPRLQLARLVSEKTSDLMNLDQSRPISSRRLRDSAVYDIYTIPFPSSNNFTYKVRVQVQYQQQMNEIIEKIDSRLEFYNVPCFVMSLSGDHRESAIKTGDGSTELAPAQHSPFDSRVPLSDYYCVGYIQGRFSDEGNLDEFTDQERIMQMRFEFMVPTALMLQPEADRPAVQRERTAFSVSILSEEVHVVESAEQADLIFGKEK